MASLATHVPLGESRLGLMGLLWEGRLLLRPRNVGL
jgi:hypothetical protein